jgi:hypothetical protein
MSANKDSHMPDTKFIVGIPPDATKHQQIDALGIESVVATMLGLSILLL